MKNKAIVIISSLLIVAGIGALFFYLSSSVKDTDNDGIPDDKDKCPEVFGSIEHDGCMPSADDYIHEENNDDLEIDIEEPIDYKGIIQEFYDAEDSRDFSHISNYYANTIENYFGKTNLSKSDLQVEYESAWSKMGISKNTILNIRKLSDNPSVYIVDVQFQFSSRGRSDVLSVNSLIEITFNELQKIKSIRKIN